MDLSFNKKFNRMQNVNLNFKGVQGTYHTYGPETNKDKKTKVVPVLSFNPPPYNPEKERAFLEIMFY